MFGRGGPDLRGSKAGWLSGLLVFALAGGAAASMPDGVQTPATSGDDATDSAVAAVVVAALGEQFSGNGTVSVRLDSIDVQAAGERDRVVSGAGRVRLGEDPDWIGFRYRTRYDATFGNAGYPELTIGGVDADERNIPNDALLVRQLDDQVVADLDRAHGGSARLQLDHIDSAEAGRRFLRISASGIVDFGLRGLTPIRIESLYDVSRSAWQRVYYELGLAADAPE